jgi:hypothetical protein
LPGIAAPLETQQIAGNVASGGGNVAVIRCPGAELIPNWAGNHAARNTQERMESENWNRLKHAHGVRVKSKPSGMKRIPVFDLFSRKLLKLRLSISRKQRLNISKGTSS